jgi:hypothetical protein
MDSEQDEEARADLSVQLATNGDPGLGDPLTHGAHFTPHHLNPLLLDRACAAL